MKNYDFSEIKLHGFLREKQKLNEDVSINSVYDRFCETGRFAALKCDKTVNPHIFWDSDIAKWIEGASYILKTSNRPDLEEKIESAIDDIEKNQWDDGYINSFYTVSDEKRFSNYDNHELYCAGHLIEGAIAYAEATGKTRLLKICERYCDLIEKEFITEKTSGFSLPGHEEIELALLKLYEYTKNEKYFNMAKYFLEERGRHDDVHFEYNQSHLPIREQDKAVGHCVRALYLYSAMADYARITCDHTVADACETLFNDIVSTKMYVTGGVGSTYAGECFENGYDLPNEDAYSETCASIAMMFFANRMFMLSKNSKYTDVVERALYNGVLSGVSLDGRGFFYLNPLAITQNEYCTLDGKRRSKYPITERVTHFGCSCCPPNMNRLFPRLADYVFAGEGVTLYVNQFVSAELSHKNKSCKVKTNYPQDGKIEIEATEYKTVAVRIPSWCKKYRISGKYELKGGYAYIQNDGKIEIELDMAPQFVYSNTRVVRDNFRACVQRGPIVYCIEECDNGDIGSLAFDTDGKLDVKYSEQFGLPIITADGYRLVSQNKSLYTTDKPTYEKTKIKLIPYSCFANRGSTDMSVWVNVK